MRYLYVMIILAILGVVSIVGCGKEDCISCDSDINVRIVNATPFEINKIQLFDKEIDILLSPNTTSDYFQLNGIQDTTYADAVVYTNNFMGGIHSITGMIGITNAFGNEDTIPSIETNGCYLFIIEDIDTSSVFITNNLYAQLIKE